MKNKDLKKGKESIIGKIIYGFLLFMPLLAIAVTCLYTIFNKNAYQSYANNYPEKNYINEVTQLNTGTTYYILGQLKNEEITNANSPYGILYQDLDNFYTTKNLDYTPNTTGRFNFTYYGGHNYIQFLNNDGTSQGQAIDLYQQTVYFTFKYISGNLTNEQIPTNIIYTDVAGNTLNNVFYSATSQVENSNLFNWSKNSIIYTGVNATCNELNITNTFIPMLLTYWLLISVIYILYDIILMILIILHNRIHRLQDSMS